MSLQARLESAVAEIGADIKALQETKVSSLTVTNIVKLTQAEYDALTPPDPSTLYAIVG